MNKSNSVRIVFMGTPHFAVPILQTLLTDNYEVAAVVTQPDRPQGRRRLLTPSAVKMAAEGRGIPVLQPEKLRLAENVAKIIQLQPDLIVTAAYGQILPKSLLSAPPLGCINVHASLLPKYRGGAPIQHAIMDGEKVTGVTLMYMAEGMDTGDIIAQAEIPINDADNAGTMFERLSELGARLLHEILPAIISETAQSYPQDHALATYAPNIKREDEQIRWQRTAKEIVNQVRGLAPKPGAYTYNDGRVFKIWECTSRPEQDHSDRGNSGSVPGEVLQMNEQGIEVMTGSGSVWLTVVQPSGGKRMEVAQFVRGSKLHIGDVLS